MRSKAMVLGAIGVASSLLLASVGVSGAAAGPAVTWPSPPATRPSPWSPTGAVTSRRPGM